MYILKTYLSESKLRSKLDLAWGPPVVTPAIKRIAWMAERHLTSG